jgi:hypothetical protein
MTTTTTGLVPFTHEEKRKLMGMAYSGLLDQLHEAQQTVAWYEGGTDRLSPHKLLRGNSRRTWMDRAENGTRALGRARQTVIETIILIEKMEALFDVAEREEVDAFAAAMAARWSEAKAADAKAKGRK